MLEKLLAKRHIRQLDLTSVRRKVFEDLSWGSEKIDQAELEYRQFLYALARKRQEDLISPPNPEVDEFWHRHILDTRKYREDCQLVFGHYMDHAPGLGPEEQARADTRRREIYNEYEIDGGGFDSPDGPSSFGNSSPSAAGQGAHSGAHGCDVSGHDGGGPGGDSGCADGGGSDGGSGCGGGGGSCGGGCGG
jgi:hypothetical protein